MPFYFANPRSGGTAQSGRTDRIEYQRTAATQVMIAVTGVLETSWIIFREYVHAIMKITSNSDETEEVRADTINYHYPSHFSLSNCLPIKAPDVALVFDSFNPPRDCLEKLEEYGAESKKIAGVKGDVWTIKSPTYEMLLEIMEFPQLDKNFRPIMGHITPYAINTYLRILTIISTLSITMINAFSNGTVDGAHTPTFSYRVVEPTNTPSGEDQEMEEGELAEEGGAVSADISTWRYGV
jgi:hypothetical protein